MHTDHLVYFIGLYTLNLGGLFQFESYLSLSFSQLGLQDECILLMDFKTDSVGDSSCVCVDVLILLLTETLSSIKTAKLSLSIQSVILSTWL